MTATVAPATTGLPDWQLCPGCRALLYRRRLERTLQVCPECGHHGRVTAAQRIEQLFDPGSVRPLPGVEVPVDPLGFTDSQPYPRRLSAARRATGLAEAVVCVRGDVEGRPLVAAVMDFRFLGGSLGTEVGERITRAAEEALHTRTPLLLVSSSGGARMQEGALSLMQMAKTSQALGELDEAGVLTLSVITDPTYGGVAASYATLCDVILAEPGARLGFAGPRVIQQTLRQPLPPGFQTAERLFHRGMIDDIVPRAQLRSVVGRLLAFAVAASAPRRADPAPAGPDPGSGLVRDPGALADDPAWDVVARSRRLGRPTTADYVGHLTGSFVELHGDRLSADCTAILGGVGTLDGRAVVMIGHQKGRTVAELAERNFGMATPAGYRKAARLMRLADKVGAPVLTLIDTPGAFHGVSAEEDGQALAIAENLRLMAGLTVPVVAVVTGEGGSGGALALGVANRVLMLSDATYSVISPEGCAAILWGDAGQAARAAGSSGCAPRTCCGWASWTPWCRSRRAVRPSIRPPPPMRYDGPSRPCSPSWKGWDRSGCGPSGGPVSGPSERSARRPGPREGVPVPDDEPIPADPLEAACRTLGNLITSTPGPLRRMSVRHGDLTVELEWPEPVAAAPPTAAVSPAPLPAAPDAGDDAGLHYVRASMVATFYVAAQPGAEPFVRAGDVVRPGQQVAILEAMKMMIPVEADRGGEVVKILVPDGSPVEYGEPLIAVAPAGE